jgi:hypothetical protein
LAERRLLGLAELDNGQQTDERSDDDDRIEKSPHL